MENYIPSPHEPTESWYNHIIPKRKCGTKKKKNITREREIFYANRGNAIRRY